jgi:double-stranded uracil-DNA glycosylase
MKGETGAADDAATLPDLLRPGLAVVFVGINPSLYSVARGHYFARSTNRFWPAFSQSRLSLPVRRGIGVERLLPEHDRLLPDYGFGFTDAVKRATARAADLGREEFIAAVANLVEKIAAFRPRIACFHGIMAYRQVSLSLGEDGNPKLGLQEIRIGESRIFLAPNPSPANAHVTPAQQTGWYDRLAELLD